MSRLRLTGPRPHPAMLAVTVAVLVALPIFAAWVARRLSAGQDDAMAATLTPKDTP